MDTPQQHEDVISPPPPPQAKWWVDGQRIRHKGFWFKPEFITATEAIRAHYTPLPSDIILASFPKTGTTWLKALTSSILRHSSTIHNNHDHMDNLNPHELVPFLEIELFGETPSKDITKITSPRVFNTHLPLSFLPDTLKTSGSKVIYITRHPADTFVSLWHLYNNKFGTEISIQEAFDDFCKGLVPAGPYFDHVLEFWEARDQDRVLFVTYEDLKGKPEENVKRIADFLGCETMVEKVVEECSFENLRNASKERGEGVHWSGTKYDMFFRKGVVGDWKNHLTQEMMKELEDIADMKWSGSGLDLNIFNNSASQ
ncbi:unnamed protein product [Eruca vesicaria subsp. sativa]|uniref:Sulfotransferase n=1 Tax=Eruca vesicaria subsp. sativa TaxID=29727 RepID=A0ABC8L730_ERUVS|nr:unnamed protein product [Eruca vesicaria subsp. sativa]